MSYEQFWYDDVDILNIYVRAEEIRQKKRNGEFWLQGLYVYSAIGNLAPVLNGFVKNPKPTPYMKQPIPITEEERVEQENQKVIKFTEHLKSLTNGGRKNNG